jgi:uncharacterized protein with GYD domain
MKAVILLRTNPGFQKEAYTALQRITKAPPSGAANMVVSHVFGRFDGVVTCDCTDSRTLNALGEALRSEGVFYTETLIAID